MSYVGSGKSSTPLSSDQIPDISGWCYDWEANAEL